MLAIQDTTAISYGGHPATEGLVGLGGGGKGTDGLMAHAGLAVGAGGRPLGLSGLNATFRDDGDAEDEAKESVRWCQGLDRAGELAEACPDTRVISVCDREGDFWQLLSKAVNGKQGLLVRASRSSRRTVIGDDGGRTCLWKHVAARPRLCH